MLSATDKELLTRYAAANDDRAFAELVSRYGAMVYRVCRRILGSPAEAEDAAQASFVVLARKAGSLRQEGRVNGWLHRVARNVALQAVRRRAERERLQAQAMVWQEDLGVDAAEPDRQAILQHLDAELDGLSTVLREALVLRFLRGLSEKEAAAQAGCPVGTMKWRASEGLAKLRARLNQRGLALNNLALLGLLQAATQTAVPATLPAAILATVKSAAGTGAASAAGSARALTLAKSALKTLFWAKVRTAAVAAVLGLGVIGIVVATHSVFAGRTAAPAPMPPAAVADGGGMKKLSPEDAWIRELLARAEGASWEALDFKPGTIFGDTGAWRLDVRGEPAARRIWQTDPRASSMVLFDAAKWKRAVIVGRVMMLPEGELPAALAAPAEATATPWTTSSDVRLAGNIPNGVYLVFHWGPAISITSAMTVKDHPRGVWHRLAVYFDTEVEPKTLVAIALKAWPEDRTVPAAALWNRPRKEDFGGITGNAVGLGLYAKQVPVLWQGIKVVPLGPDLPPPPPGVAGR